MTEWRIPGMPRVPGLSEALALMQAQAESLSDLPAAMGELNRVVGGLTAALTATTEAAASAERTTARVERILDEIEGPILALRPGLERVARVLDDPAIDRIPATLAVIEQTVIPIAERVQRARSRYGDLKARARALAERARTRHGRAARPDPTGRQDAVALIPDQQGPTQAGGTVRPS